MSHALTPFSLLRNQPRKVLRLLGAWALLLIGSVSLGHAQTSTTDTTDATNSGASATNQINTSSATVVVNNSSLTLSGATTYFDTTTLTGGTLTLLKVGSNDGTGGTTTFVNWGSEILSVTDPLTVGGTLAGSNTSTTTGLVLTGTGGTLGVTDPLTLNFANNFYTGVTISSGSWANYGTLIDYGSVNSYDSSISFSSAISSGSVITVVGGPPSTAVTRTIGSTLLLGSTGVVSSGTSLLSNANGGTITLDVSGTNTAASMVNSLGTLPTSGTLVLSSGGVLNLTGISVSGLTVTGSTHVNGGTTLGSTGLTLTGTGTTQATGSVNVTTLGSVPVGNTPTSVSFAAPAVALLGVGNVGAQGISERGVIYSLTSANGSPTLGGSGVVKVVHTGNPTANGSFSLTAAGLAANTSYTYRVYATDSTGVTILSTPATFKTPTVLQNWRQTFFGTIQGADLAADNADPDGDGVPNLLEFATGKDPTTSQNSSSTASTNVNGSSLEYLYLRSLDALNSGTTFFVEWNDSLNPAQWSSTGVSEVILSDDGIKQQVKASVPAGSTGRRFMRLKVVPPPAQ